MTTDDFSDIPDWDEHRFSFGDDEEGEGWKPNPTRDACKALYRQWRHVIFLLNGLLAAYLDIEDGQDELMFKDTARQVIADAHLVGAKIMSSEAAGIYIARMENAAVIRQYAQSVSTSLLLFLEDDDADEQHIEVVRDEIRKFKMLFIAWVKTFKKDEFTDDWELFV